LQGSDIAILCKALRGDKLQEAGFDRSLALWTGDIALFHLPSIHQIVEKVLETGFVEDVLAVQSDFSAGLPFIIANITSEGRSTGGGKRRQGVRTLDLTVIAQVLPAALRTERSFALRTLHAVIVGLVFVVTLLYEVL